MKYVLVNYNHDPSWVKRYTSDYLIYDRSDDGNDWCEDIPEDKVIRTDNVGNVDYDRLSYIVDNYDNLPDVFLLAKSNLFKYIRHEEFKAVKDRKEFTPLLTMHHKTYSDQFGVVCFYDEKGMYHERNNSWYLNSVPAKHFGSYEAFAKEFNLPNPRFLAFAPGGNYILTKEVVHRYPKESYDKMRSILPYTREPGEAQMVERSLYNLWS